MKLLTIDGYGYNLSVDGGRLEATNGHYINRPKQTTRYRRKNLDFDKVVISGNHGTLSVSAIRWLVKQKRDIVILDWNGRLVTAFSPHANQGVSKLAQLKASQDPIKKTKITKWLIQQKIEGSLRILEWIRSKNRNFTYDSIINKQFSRFKTAIALKEILGIESVISHYYFNAVSSVIDSKWEFITRHAENTPVRDADDPVNALFNYGYSILESECWKVVNTMGLEPYIGFIHTTHTNKTPMVYDLEEPFRWLVEKAILKLIFEKKVQLSNFMTTDYGNVRLKPNTVKLVLDEIAKQFRTTVLYRGKRRQWSTMIMLKTRELIRLF